MNKTAQAGPARHTVDPSEQLTIAFGWFASALAGASLLLVVWTLVSPAQLPGKAGWPEATLVFTTAIATLVALSRQLPGQNVILAAAVIALIGGIAHAVGAATAIPFGPFIYTDSAGPKILGLLPWPMPAIWIIAILNSRGVARLILRPWRKLRTYGFWLIGVTAALTVMFAVALDPFAAKVKHYWLWEPTRFPLTWHGAPQVNFLGWLVTALLILAFATPALINKQPRSRKSPPDYHPLVVWLLALALFATGAIAHNLWTAMGFCLLSGTATAFFAIRGARW
jgi:putative membrane protein